MHVPISQRSVHEVDELRVAAVGTLAVLELALAAAVDQDGSHDYGVDLADAATLAEMTATLTRFLKRDLQADQA